MNTIQKTSRTAYLLLAAGIILTILSGVLVQKAVDTYREMRIQSYSNEIEDYIHFRFQNYINTLAQTAAFFEAVPDPAPRTFETYSAAYLKIENYPGLEGIGFCKTLDYDQIKAYEAKMNSLGQKDFKIWSSGTASGKTAEHCAILYRSPMDEKNKRAIGYDMVSDQQRLETLHQARDSGKPTATPLLNLMQDKMDGSEKSEPKNFIIFTPVYKTELPVATVEERRAALQGFVYSPFRAEQLFDSLFQRAGKPHFSVNFNIYEHDLTQKERLLFASNEILIPDKKTVPLEVRREITVAGRQWTLLVAPGEQFHRGFARNLPALVMFFNLVLTVLMFWLKKSNEREKQSRQDAEKSVMIRDEFLSIASHELKTPLTPLSLQLEILKKALNDTSGRFTRERMTASIETCIRSLRRLTTLVEDMLDVSRISNGKLQFEMEPMNLSATLRDIAGRFANQIAASGSTLTLKIEEDIIGHWDQFRIEQVIVNLISNAIKYGGGKPITIELARAGEEAVLTVADGGIGISPVDHARIFNRFERVTSSSNIKGLGLGLYIVKMIIVGHHGRIRVESEPSEGSKFVVELPLHASRDPNNGVALELQKTLATPDPTGRQPS